MENKFFDQFDMDIINKLADIISSKELSEITLADDERKITIKGKKCPPSAPMPAFIGGMPMTSTPTVPNTEPANIEPLKEETGNVVKSPIVGTFYSAPAPDKAPFVKIGDKVKKGDVIMIIESMKLMNEVLSEFDGVVKDILVRDAEAVEYDQPLMIIE